jgi:hypothetical protein
MLVFRMPESHPYFHQHATVNRGRDLIKNAKYRNQYYQHCDRSLSI